MRHFSKTFLALGLSLAVAVVGCKSVFEDNDYAYDKNAVSSEDDDPKGGSSEDPDDYTLSTDTSKIAYIHCKNNTFSIEGNASLVDALPSMEKVLFLQ